MSFGKNRFGRLKNKKREGVINFVCEAYYVEN